MKAQLLHIIPSFFLIIIFSGSSVIPFSPAELKGIESYENGLNAGQQDDESSSGKMSAVVFKNQDYCRAELKDFEFDVQFRIVSATVYFSGSNFKSLQKGFLNSSSLRPVKSLMEQCIPGSIVMFDDVRVIGPDNLVRKIPGATYILY